MTVLTESSFRVDLTLSGRFDLDAELGDFGRSVVRRTARQAKGQRKGEEEDFCLRHLLLAWERVRELRRPIHVTAPQRGWPDFRLEWPNGGKRSIGVEITRATTQAEQRWFKHTESEFAALLPSEDGYVDSAEIQRRAGLIAGAIVKKRDDYADRRLNMPLHLVVYENVATPEGIDAGEVVKTVVNQNAEAAAAAMFAQVHVIIGSSVFLDVFGGRKIVDLSADYSADFYQWTRSQARALRDGKLAEIDATNLAEEIESMGKSDRRALESQLTRLLVHLLKWEFQPRRRSASWRLSISNARMEIDLIVEDSPSLARKIPELVTKAYSTAAKAASVEMGVSISKLPKNCPYASESVLDADFWPQ
jgi:hypothetical protein